MQKLRERFDNVQQEQQEVEKAFDVIKEITDGQFNDSAYLGDDKHFKQMLQQFDSIKPILFYTRNNKWLIMKYVAKHGEYINGDKSYSLCQLVSILLGFQGQDAIDNNNETLEDKLHIECCIWQSIILGAKYCIARAS